ncbi:MAG TPA: hypothetical protein V6C89_21905 [Drouetiella sp.]
MQTVSEISTFCAAKFSLRHCKIVAIETACPAVGPRANGQPDDLAAAYMPGDKPSSNTRRQGKPLRGADATLTMGPEFFAVPACAASALAAHWARVNAHLPGR